MYGMYMLGMGNKGIAGCAYALPDIPPEEYAYCEGFNTFTFPPSESNIEPYFGGR